MSCIMRRFKLWIGPALLLVSTLLCAQQSGMEGTVIDAVTQQPMAGVHIILRPASVSGVAVLFTPDGHGSESTVTYGAISQRDGHFSIAGVKPDVYFVQAERNGYVRTSGNSTVALKSGEPLTGVAVAMSPRGVIYGHLFDENGDPAQHLQVYAMPVTPGAYEVESDPTDERGQFRLPVAPGKFYVIAEFRNMRAVDEIRSDGRETSGYTTTYYPGVASKDQAVPLQVRAAEELTGVDIHLVRTRRVTIRGTVTGIPKGEHLTEVWLLADNFYPMRPYAVASDGKFTISGVAADRYHLVATEEYRAPFLRSRIAAVDVGSGADSTVDLALIHGETETGTVEMEGDPPKIAPTEKLTLAVSDASNMNPVKAEVGKDGAFRLEQVFPERLQVSVSPMPENSFVKSVKLDGVEMADRVLDLSRGAGGARIKITLSRNGGRVEGKVLDEGGGPLRGPFAFVALAQTADDIDYDKLTPVEAGARFRFTGLRPGKYRLIAVDPAQLSGVYPSDSTTLRALFPRGPEVDIHEGDRIAMDAKVIPREKLGATQ